MDIVGDPSSTPPPPRGSVVTIGAYDGLHLGHRALLSHVRRKADQRGLAMVVVTFDQHPAAVVRPESAPKLLCDLDQKLELLSSSGVDRAVVIRFDEARANETAEEFVEGTLVRQLSARLVVVGEDFHFGHGRKGNVALLADLGTQAGFEVEGMRLEAHGPGHLPISSTRIRALVAAGRMEEAASLLGRLHQVRGTVIHGDHRGGAELGFPTANLLVDPAIALPGAGIYAGWYERPDGELLASAVSVGRRPTFYGGGGELLVEAFLLDYSGNLYGEAGRLSFVARIRDELAFASVDELVARMHLDVAATREILAAHDRKNL